MAKFTKANLQEATVDAKRLLESYASICEVKSRETGIQRSQQLAWVDEATRARECAEAQVYIGRYIVKSTPTKKDEAPAKADAE